MGSSGIWSDFELAELQPRRNPPTHSPLLPGGIPRIQPQVPEISLFEPSSRKPAAQIEEQEEVHEVAVESPVAPTKEVSPDVLDILRVQSDQLMKLQTQVQRLLSIQSERDEALLLRSPKPASPPPLPPPSPPFRVEEAIQVCSLIDTFDNFTQTSAPPSPPRPSKIPLPRIVIAEKKEEATQVLPTEEDKIEELPSQVEESLFLGGEHTQGSILLGESASTYGRRISGASESSCSEEQFERILCQVQRLLSPGPSLELAQKIPDKSLPENPCSQTLLKTVNRVKQMGASFLEPSDFLEETPASNNQKQACSPIDTFYEPKVKATASNSFISSNVSSSDASLIINTAAMKYLSDEQLSSLATHRKGNNIRVQGSSRRSKTPTDSPFGLCESQLSMSTKRFLTQHCLTQTEPKIIDEDVESLLKQPKLP
eukprot:TRINITY_DN2661_c0_g1_i2.p1 TRINITY_DN2661_c0_g1~~TRINITY_DN2661_c0_g1_i2.p1  ORF type:complete len:428 (+),score=104.04 TRINITY_DN2661_c0_g1_i2:44-1327(+)